MATSHGRLTVVTVATKAISPYCSTSTLEVAADVHEASGYGVQWKGNKPGLIGGTFAVSGFYDNTVSVGPRLALLPLIGTIAAVIRQVEGVGTTKPQDLFNAVINKYNETNPVD